MIEPRKPRILIYSHDTYGLGHLRRSMLIAERLVRLPSSPRVLIATGSPRAQAFAFPPNCDTLKLPAVLKQPDGRYLSRSLGIPLSETLRLRSSLLVSTVESFGPDLVLVDHAPIGVGGELLPLFARLDRLDRRPSMVLGLRDVIDDASRVRDDWAAQGVWTYLRDTYDRIMVFGDPAITTTAQELGLRSRLGDKVVHTNYLARRTRSLGAGSACRPAILVMAGGGGDGQTLLRTFAAFLAQTDRHDLRFEIVTGPFLTVRRVEALTAALTATGHEVEIHRFVPGLEELVARAAGVISMAGYNSVTEIMAADKPALLVPRTSPRREQSIRAHRLAHTSRFSCCSPDALSAREIERFVDAVVNERCTGEPRPRLDGLDRVAGEIEDLLLERTATSRDTSHERMAARAWS